MREDERREREAKAALERVARDSETLGASSVARVSRRLGAHFDGADAGADPIERWGRRIGRALSLLGVIALSLWLLAQLELI